MREENGFYKCIDLFTHLVILKKKKKFLCNRDMMVNLSKLHFPISHFYFQPNKGKYKSLYPPLFHSSNQTHMMENTNIFLSS